MLSANILYSVRTNLCSCIMVFIHKMQKNVISFFVIFLYCLKGAAWWRYYINVDCFLVKSPVKYAESLRVSYCTYKRL